MTDSDSSESVKSDPPRWFQSDGKSITCITQLNPSGRTEKVGSAVVSMKYVTMQHQHIFLMNRVLLTVREMESPIMTPPRTH